MIRFLADASLHNAIVSGCFRRESTIDFLSAQEARLKAYPTPRCRPSPLSRIGSLVTSDLRTMPRHFGDFLEANGQCASVFLGKQRTPLADAIDALVLVWSASDAEECNRNRDSPAQRRVRGCGGHANPECRFTCRLTAGNRAR
jgi:hypothetical protein